jgi:hypothetical protein
MIMPGRRVFAVTGLFQQVPPLCRPYAFLLVAAGML